MVRLVIVGVGRQGQRYLRVARSLPGASVVATVDPVAGREEGIPHFPTIAAALDAVDVDAAVVASPSRLHCGHGSELVEAGVPVLVEKPLATTEADAALIEKLSAEKGVLVAVGHVERFNPAVGLVESMLQAGEVGTPLSFSFRRVGLPPASGHEDGVVHDLAVHDIDVFAHLSGPPTLTGASGWPRTPAPEAAFLLASAGDVNGLVEVNWRTPVRIRQFTMTTDTCVVMVDYTVQRVEVSEAVDPASPLEFAAFQSHYSASRRVVYDPQPGEPLLEQLKAFLASVSGTVSSRLATAEDGRRAVAVAEAATDLIAR